MREQCQHCGIVIELGEDEYLDCNTCPRHDKEDEVEAFSSTCKSIKTKTVICNRCKSRLRVCVVKGE